LTNLAGHIAGRLASLEEKVSLTNQTFPNVSLRYFLDDQVADVAAGARLVIMISDNGVATVPDGPTFALLTSDFTRITTMRSAARVVKELRRSTKRFLGKALSATGRAALEQAIEGVLENAQKSELIRSANYTLRQTRSQQILGQIDMSLQLLVPYELRQIFINVNLGV
jgi:hypothetical protein